MVRINAADLTSAPPYTPSVLTEEDRDRLLVEASAGIPLAESLVAASAERDREYARALAWVTKAKSEGREFRIGGGCCG